MKHLLWVKETWVDRNFRSDVEAVKGRVMKAWGPRWRNSFVVKGKEGGEGEESIEKNEVEKYKKTEHPQVPIMVDDLVQSLIDPSQFYDAEEQLIDSDSDSESDVVFPDAGGSFSFLGSLDTVEEGGGMGEEELSGRPHNGDRWGVEGTEESRSKVSSQQCIADDNCTHSHLHARRAPSLIAVVFFIPTLFAIRFAHRSHLLLLLWFCQRRHYRECSYPEISTIYTSTMALTRPAR